MIIEQRKKWKNPQEQRSSTHTSPLAPYAIVSSTNSKAQAPNLNNAQEPFPTPSSTPGQEAYCDVPAEEAGCDDRALVTPISPWGCRANEQADECAKPAADARHVHGVGFLRYGVRYGRNSSPQVSRPPRALDHRDQVEGGEDLDGCEGYPQEVPVRQKPVSVPANAAFLEVCNCLTGQYLPWT